MSKRDPNVRAFLDKQVHIATEHFGKLDPLDLDEYLAHGGFEALRKCLGIKLNDRPHPGPLPQERRNVRRLHWNRLVALVRAALDLKQPDSRCPLSPGERVRVRASVKSNSVRAS